ncbi:MAG: TetR/AcrR family transcriptional regulator [Alphaproteobacteria bacterium]|nr:TetR/AcrR family transcriptional regulator [Alphaproteobacteria bacterium]
MSSENTKEKILLSARKLFVEYGFAGTSMGQIAKLAQVNHSLIFHHFENKEKLWLAVKQSIVKEKNQQSKMLPSTDQPFYDFLYALVIKSIKFYRDHPDIMRMISWQRLERSHEEVISLTLSSETQSWINAFKHYQQCGEVNPQLKPEFIVVFVLSIVHVAASDHTVFTQTLANEDAYILFCVERIQKALG